MGQEAEERQKRLAEAPTAGEMELMEDNEIARAGGGPVSVPRYSTPEQRSKVSTAAAGVGSAANDLQKWLTIFPQLLSLISGQLPQLPQMPHQTPATTPAGGDDDIVARKLKQYGG